MTTHAGPLGSLEADKRPESETEIQVEPQTEALKRKIKDYDRWFRFLDGQMRVLERERQKLSAVVNHADAGFLVLDSTLKVVWANEQLTGWFGAGTHKGTVLGESCNRFLCGLDAPCESCPAAHAFGSATVAHHEIRREIDGRARHVYATAMPIKSPDGEIEETIVMLQDVSDLEILKQSQEALKSSEEKFRSIFENAAAGMATISPEGVFLQVNQALCDFLGYPEEELISRPVLDFTHPDDLPLSRQKLGEVLTGSRRTVELEKRYIRKDGAVVWGHVSSTWLFDPEGRPNYGVTLILDITERKSAEKARSQSEARKGAILDTSLDAVVSIDHLGRITEFNPAAEQMFGYPRQEAMGRQMVELIVPPELREAHRHGLRRYLETGNSRVIGKRIEMEALRSDGSVFPVEIAIGRIEMDGPAFFTAYIRDLTERRKAEVALRTSEERFRMLVETVSVIPWELDLACYRFTYVGPQAVPILGYPVEEWYGEKFWEDHLHPEDREWAPKFCAEATMRGENHEFEYRMISQDGQVVWLRDLVTVVSGKHGATGLRGFMIDISERKKSEEALRRSEEQLRQSQKMEAIGTLAGGVAHDFNNILTGILGHSELLKLSTETGDRVFRSADVIERAARRASELTQQLLGFARRGKNQDVPVDLRDTVREVIGLLGRTLDKNITITQQFHPGNCFVMGDPGQMQQVILNLAVNARDAMPQGGTLSFTTDERELDEDACRRHSGLRPGRYVVAAVTDTGSGIPAEVRERIFEPFFTTKERGKGTGMGLAMVYGIIRNHGGWVAVESEDGRGASFQIYLPRAEEVRPAESSAGADAEERGSGRILVVDDEDVVRGLISTYLRRLGYDVVTAADGVDAVETYKSSQRPIDLVLVDMIMPRMGGRDCFRALKELDPRVRAILSTGYGFNSAAQQILDEGMLGFIKKPFELRQLAKAVADALKK